MKISIVIPTYNEEENVVPMAEAVVQTVQAKLPEYDWEIIFIDNYSSDQTRTLLRELCQKNTRIKAIFNTRNFGQTRSPFYGMLQTTGDAVIKMCADFQEPVEFIPKLVHEWENGNRIVLMQKTASKERHIMYFLRSIYYKLLKKYSDVKIIEHITGFGIYDREIIKKLEALNDPMPFLRGMIAELGYEIKVIPYTQQKRRAGKTHNNFFTLYDLAMLSFTSYTKIGLRLSTFLGFGAAAICLIFAVIYFILKLLYWDRFIAGTTPIMLGMFFLGAVVLIFLGLMGEYLLAINTRLMNRPLVIEEERINF